MSRLRMIILAGIVLAGFASLATVYAANRNYSVHLKGEHERPTPRDTQAQGQTIFHLSKDGTELHYKLIVANIENVFAAHIHCGGTEVAGPVGVTLFSAPVVVSGSGRVSGVLEEGTVTAPDPGNGCGWTTLAQVVAAMNAGNAYVNVHTNDGVAPTNTGPGDFPGGEVRGQIPGDD